MSRLTDKLHKTHGTLSLLHVSLNFFRNLHEILRTQLTLLAQQVFVVNAVLNITILALKAQSQLKKAFQRNDQAQKEHENNTLEHKNVNKQELYRAAGNAVLFALYTLALVALSLAPTSLAALVFILSVSQLRQVGLTAFAIYEFKHSDRKILEFQKIVKNTVNNNADYSNIDKRVLRSTLKLSIKVKGLLAIIQMLLAANIILGVLIPPYALLSTAVTLVATLIIVRIHQYYNKQRFNHLKALFKGVTKIGDQCNTVAAQTLTSTRLTHTITSTRDNSGNRLNLFDSKAKQEAPSKSTFIARNKS